MRFMELSITADGPGKVRLAGSVGHRKGLAARVPKALGAIRAMLGWGPEASFHPRVGHGGCLVCPGLFPPCEELNMALREL